MFCKIKISKHKAIVEKYKVINNRLLINSIGLVRDAISGSVFLRDP
jgi:hypothetical protein